MEARQLNVSEHDPSDPRDVFKLLWRRRWVLLATIVLIPGAVYLYSSQLTKTYEASTVLQVQPIADASSVFAETTAEPAKIAAVARLAETSGVADEVARILRQRRGSLRGSVKALSDEDTGFVTLTASAGSDKQAAQIANAAGRVLNAQREKAGVTRANKAIAGVQRDLQNTPRTLAAQDERQQLSEQLQRLRTLRAAQGSNATVVEPAGLTGAEVSPNPTRNAVLALVLALLLGVGLTVLLDRMDRRLRDVDEVEKLVGVPLLAVIPKGAFPGGRPSKRHVLAFQTLRDSLTYFNVDRTLTTIAVTSPLQAEGKTTVSTNLAVSLARANKRVILMDADLRKPQVGVRMGIEETSGGLSSVLLGASLEDTLREIPPFGSRLRVLPAGPRPPNPSELIGSKRMSALLDEVAELADVVVIDTTPLLVVSDVFPLLEQCSGVVGIARLDQTPRDAVRRMVEVTRTAGGRMIGMVATGAKGGGLRGYDYGYGYDSKLPIVGTTVQSRGNGAAPAAPAKSGNGVPLAEREPKAGEPVSNEDAAAGLQGETRRWRAKRPGGKAG